MNAPFNWIAAQRQATCAAILAAESPAEAVLLVHMLCARDGEGYAFGGDGCAWRLETQLEVTVERKLCRLDIALARGPHRVCVEVDGHEWHHANDDQEARDAARDFALRAAGWTVIRLDAWKVFENPSGVVSDLLGRLQEIERVGAPKPPRPSPNAELIERLRRDGISEEEENDILREVERRARIRFGLDAAGRKAS